MLRLRSARGRRKAQHPTVLLAFTPPVAGDTSYLPGLAPVRVELTPIGFLVSGAMLTYALFRRGFMDLVPVARGIVVEHMMDGVIVLDDRGRVIDLHPAARVIPGLAGSGLIGSRASDVLPLLVQPGAASDTVALVQNG